MFSLKITASIQVFTRDYEWMQIPLQAKYVYLCLFVCRLASMHSLKQMSVISAFSLNIDQWSKQWLYFTSYDTTQPQLSALVSIIWMNMHFYYYY